MSDIYNKIKAIKPYTRIKWPGTDDVYVRLYIANQQIINTATLAADKIFKDVAIGLHNMEDYRAEKNVQIFYRIIKDDSGKDICTISEFKKLLTPDIFEWLDDEHEILQEEYAPQIDQMPDSEFDKLIEALKKKPEETLLDNCSIYTLRRVCLFLASPPPSLTADS